jgi:polysaccharide export outer membrane protein
MLVLVATFALPRAAEAQTYATLVPGDVVRIAVYGNPDLTTVTRVLPNGTISFPLIGTVNVGGRSPVEAEKMIADRLSNGGFVKNAAVSVFVQEQSTLVGATATLLGQVAHSGSYSLDPQSPEGVTSLVELLAKAGGTTEKGADYCYLIRNENGQQRKLRVDLADMLRNGDVKANMPLKDKDIVLVPEMDVFYIYGEVQRPGRYKLEREMTIMQALSVASGLTPRGSAKGITLNRQVGGTVHSADTGLDDKLQPNDVVYVRTAVF